MPFVWLQVSFGGGCELPEACQCDSQQNEAECDEYQAQHVDGGWAAADGVLQGGGLAEVIAERQPVGQQGAESILHGDAIDDGGKRSQQDFDAGGVHDAEHHRASGEDGTKQQIGGGVSRCGEGCQSEDAEPDGEWVWCVDEHYSKTGGGGGGGKRPACGNEELTEQQPGDAVGACGEVDPAALFQFCGDGRSGCQQGAHSAAHTGDSDVEQDRPERVSVGQSDLAFAVLHPA